MEFYEDDLQVYKHVYFDDSIQVLFYYLIILFFIKWYFRL